MSEETRRKATAALTSAIDARVGGYTEEIRRADGVLFDALRDELAPKPQPADDACKTCSASFGTHQNWCHLWTPGTNEAIAAKMGFPSGPQPTPAKCEECGGTDGEHAGPPFKRCFRATPPSAKDCDECKAKIEIPHDHKYGCSKHPRNPPSAKGPPQCTECGGIGGVHRLEAIGNLPPCSKPSAKGAAETMPEEWPKPPESLGLIWSMMQERWVQTRKSGPETVADADYIRADEVERRVAEAKRRAVVFENESWCNAREALSAGATELLVDAARRVVAALEASVASEAALLEGIRKAEASEHAAQAKVRDLEHDKQCTEESLATMIRELSSRHEEKEAAVASLRDCETDREGWKQRAETAETKVRELEASEEVLDADRIAAIERAETAERELTISRADYRKACEELRTQQDKTVSAERELGEARATLENLRGKLKTEAVWLVDSANRIRALESSDG